MKSPRANYFSKRAGRSRPGGNAGEEHAQAATPPPFDLDLTVLLAAAGADGISLTKLALDATNITGRKITEDDVRAQLKPLLERGAVGLNNGRLYLK